MKAIIAVMALMVSSQSFGKEIKTGHKYEVYGSGYRVNILEFTPKSSNKYLCFVAIDSSGGNGLGVGISCVKKEAE